MGTENEAVMDELQDQFDRVVAEHSEATRQYQDNLDSYCENGEWGWFLDVALKATKGVFEDEGISEYDANVAVKTTADYIKDTARAYEAMLAEKVDISAAPKGLVTLPLRNVFEYIQATGPLFGLFLAHVTRAEGSDGVSIITENADTRPEVTTISPQLLDLLDAAAQVDSGEMTEEEFDAEINSVLDELINGATTEEEIG